MTWQNECWPWTKWNVTADGREAPWIVGGGMGTDSMLVLDGFLALFALAALDKLLTIVAVARPKPPAVLGEVLGMEVRSYSYPFGGYESPPRCADCGQYFCRCAKP